MNDFAKKLSELSMELYDIDDGATMELTADSLTISVFTITVMLTLANGTISFEECTTTSLEDFDTVFKIMKLIDSYLED